MSDIAIRVENLGKMYRIGRAQQRHDTLRDAIAAGLSSLRPGSTSQEETIWALRDVSFEVKRGEVLGVIGRNGAGKSTLLKILSRITEPTTGRAEIHGRVGSLLEVGTGFHPELAGRENIYLNGAILGMRRTEIARRFDEIVAFAEIDKFLDTPVKHYSSGMYVRLAFAVAAHLDPEILLVDEVLAVGDAQFQIKCLGKMGDIAGEGRTVLFVSHNLVAVRQLCPRVLLLSGGVVELDDSADRVIDAYQRQNVPSPTADLSSTLSRSGTGHATFTSVSLLDTRGRTVDSVAMGEDFSIEMHFVTRQPVKHPVFAARLYTLLNQDIVAWRSHQGSVLMPETLAGGSVRVTVTDLRLLPGNYLLAVSVSDGYQVHDLLEKALTISVVPDSHYRAGSSSFVPRSELVYSPCSWEHNYR